MKYKVGDKVKIREDLEIGHTYGISGYGVSKGMLKYRGKVATIVSTNDYLHSYEIDLDEGFSWDSGMFEEVDTGIINIDAKYERTVDVEFKDPKFEKPRVIRDVFEVMFIHGGNSIVFATKDCMNEYILPIDIINWIIPHED